MYTFTASDLFVLAIYFATLLFAVYAIVVSIARLLNIPRRSRK